MSVARLVGMIHLPALPGTASWNGEDLDSIIEAAEEDVETLAQAGFDMAMVQNSLDRPTRERVDLLCVAQMTAVVTAIKQRTAIPVAVNVVKNDGPAAVAIAAATGAEFVRIKVLTGAVLSAEGIVHGCSSETQTLRARCGAKPAIWADVYEPTSRALLSDDFDAAVADAIDFGLADGVVVTGKSALETMALAIRARNARPGATVVIGGHISTATIAEAVTSADVVIVGRALKRDPGIHGRVDSQAAVALVEAAAKGGLPRIRGDVST